MNENESARALVVAAALDFALVLAVSAALAFTVSYGFNSAAAIRGNIGIICLVQVPLLVAMFWGTRGGRAVPIAIASSVVIAVAIVVIAVRLSSAPLFLDGQYNDVDGNYATFVLVALACAIVSFLLSRHLGGLVALFAIGVIACGAVQFLWRDWITDQPGLFATSVFLAGTAMLFVYQTYKRSVLTAKRAKRVSFVGAFGFSVLVGVSSVLIGVAVFYGAVAGLGLQTPEIKPFEESVARPVDDREGIWDETDVEGDEKTDEVSEEEDETKDNAEGNSESSTRQQVEDVMNAPVIGQLMQQLTGFDFEEENQDYKSISYLILQITAIIIVLAVLLALIAAILVQRGRRRWRITRMERKGMPYSQRVWELYGFLSERLARLKLKKPAYLTPYEYAIGFAEGLEPFSRDTGGVAFLDVTSTYADAAWGGKEVSAEDYAAVESFYRAFFKNARECVGWPKWLLWKFWRI